MQCKHVFAVAHINAHVYLTQVVPYVRVFFQSQDQVLQQAGRAGGACQIAIPIAPPRVDRSKGPNQVNRGPLAHQGK